MIEVIVSRKQREAVDIFSYELVPSGGGDLPPYTAGSHIDVHLPGGLVRQYSLYDLPGEGRGYRIAVLREPESRGGSVAMHDQVQEGDEITISEPRNHFELDPAADKSMLFAGGIGVTPLLAMAEQLSRSQADFEFHYCARSLDRMAFRDYIMTSGYVNQTHLHLDDGEADQKLQLHTVLAQPRPGTHLYICGPKGFMDFVIAGAKRQGWAEDQIHREYFTADPAAAQGGGLFQVKIASTGQTLTIPEDKTVVEVLREAGIDIMVSCEQGVCGTCLTPVIEGTLDHRDFFLSAEEQAEGKVFTPCCSRGKGIVVLDL